MPAINLGSRNRVAMADLRALLEDSGCGDDAIGASRLGVTTIEKRLGVTGTGRNWDTLTRMVELGRRLGQ
jgi:uncharacterized protein (DUF1697 family)